MITHTRTFPASLLLPTHSGNLYIHTHIYIYTHVYEKSSIKKLLHNCDGDALVLFLSSLPSLSSFL